MFIDLTGARESRSSAGASHPDIQGTFRSSGLKHWRRNSNDPPDGDFASYRLTKLNAAGGNYISSEMVKAFLSSIIECAPDNEAADAPAFAR
jgi:hypothetical protein